MSIIGKIWYSWSNIIVSAEVVSHLLDVGFHYLSFFIRLQIGIYSQIYKYLDKKLIVILAVCIGITTIFIHSLQILGA